MATDRARGPDAESGPRQARSQEIAHHDHRSGERTAHPIRRPRTLAEQVCDVGAVDLAAEVFGPNSAEHLHERRRYVTDALLNVSWVLDRWRAGAFPLDITIAAVADYADAAKHEVALVGLS